MLAEQQPLGWMRRTAGFLAALLLVASTPVFAQETDKGLSLASIGKRVALDPTTYAPAIIAYKATRWDWDTSQPFFQRGVNEMNPRFTVSGLPNDVPISYAAGNRKTMMDALATLKNSVLSNTASRFTEAMLEQRYPEHRKLIRTLGWAERISLGAFLSYKLSHQHFEQAQLNQTWSRQLGYTR